MSAPVFYVAKKYDNGTLRLADIFGFGDWTLRHENSRKNPAPHRYNTIREAWSAANFLNQTGTTAGSAWKVVIVTEDEMLELERGAA